MNNKTLSDDIKKFRKAIDDVAKGNFDVKIDVITNNEAKELAESFNQMTKYLKDLKSTLQEANEARLKSELKYRNLYDNSPDLYRSVNANHEIIDCNMAYVDHLGYTKEEIIGVSIFDHTAERSINDLRDMTETWKKEGRITNKEIWFKRKDGTLFPTLISSTGLRDPSGNLIGSNTVIRDMTEIYNTKTKSK
jgi:PAS domain S-box-containing protein